MADITENVRSGCFHVWLELGASNTVTKTFLSVSLLSTTFLLHSLSLSFSFQSQLCFFFFFVRFIIRNALLEW